MICGLEIGLAIFGLIALVRGKMTLSKTKVVVGVPARLIGLLALTPLPIAFAVGFVYAIVNGADAERMAKDNQLTLGLIEAGIVIGVAILVFAIGAAVAISPQEAERRERGGRYEDDEDDDYEDARPSRRREERDEDEDDRDDDRPRRRARDEDDRDDEDDRPRKPWNR